MERILGLDVGQQTLGIAISDSLGLTAQGLSTFRFPPLRSERMEDHILELVNEYHIGLIVIGLPLHMDGSMSERAQSIQELKEKLLQKISVPIVLMDERWTTKLAESRLIDANVSRAKRKTVIDKMAAVVILQDYLDRHRKKVNAHE